MMVDLQGFWSVIRYYMAGAGQVRKEKKAKSKFPLRNYS